MWLNVYLLIGGLFCWFALVRHDTAKILLEEDNAKAHSELEVEENKQTMFLLFFLFLFTWPIWLPIWFHVWLSEETQE